VALCKAWRLLAFQNPKVSTTLNLTHRGFTELVSLNVADGDQNIDEMGKRTIFEDFLAMLVTIEASYTTRKFKELRQYGAGGVSSYPHDARCGSDE
jgi:predicted amino acid-binding ACT domain protein